MEYPVRSNIQHTLFFDGSSKGNPGPAGIGAVIYHNDVEIWCSSRYIGPNKTNNEAEYTALLMGLEQALELEIKELVVCGDSLLVINQINKIYRVRDSKLIILYKEVNNLIDKFEHIVFNHVYRKENERADELANLNNGASA